MSRPDWQTVTHPASLQVLLDPRKRDVLAPFLVRPETVAGVARWLGLPLNAVYHQVKRLERLGLLEVSHSSRRRGRAVKHYQAVANGFFVPFGHSSAQDLQAFLTPQLSAMYGHFLYLMAQSGAKRLESQSSYGFRVFYADKRVQIDFVPSVLSPTVSDPLEFETPAPISTFTPLWLSLEHAQTLQAEMLALLEKYQKPSGSHPFVVHLGITAGTFKFAPSS